MNMSKKQKFNHNGHDYELNIEDNLVTVSINGKSIYKIEKEISVVISDMLDSEAFNESLELMVKTAEGDIRNGLIEKCAKRQGII